MALQGQMPLNLPANALLDGLFTSGLRFISSYPGLAASGRVATARYEMLHLTEEGHRLLPPVGGNRQQSCIASHTFSRAQHVEDYQKICSKTV